ncbi:hypothetical protein BC937DRAFT_88721 [Endogone sp. FLAS-F59071]|nr:hypothetical protein BC937DRAFT_88721 [Endogone sp. FLAS-F59071]|eukprot:RUS18486.1 hypothetical protein BC937DRAFT_88721 [Endogone sp. FLAS-F59071]
MSTPKATSSRSANSSKNTCREKQHHETDASESDPRKKPNAGKNAPSSASDRPLPRALPKSSTGTTIVACILTPPFIKKLGLYKYTFCVIYTATCVTRIKCAADSNQLDRLKPGLCFNISCLKYMQDMYTVTPETTVSTVPDNARPAFPLKFMPLADLASNNTHKTIIGVVIDVGLVVEGTAAASGNPWTKRDITLCDSTQKSIRMTLWGMNAQNFGAQPGAIVVSIDTGVREYNGFLSLQKASFIDLLIDPKLPEATALREWYKDAEKNTNGHPAGLTNMVESPVMTVAEANDLALTGTPIYCRHHATIVYINDVEFAYVACGYCNKKITDGVCTDHGNDIGDARKLYKLKIHIIDDELRANAIAFDGVGKSLFGMDAQQLEELRIEDEDAFNELFLKATDSATLYDLSVVYRLVEKPDSDFDVLCTIQECKVRQSKK